jgi:hypothetical protein
MVFSRPFLMFSINQFLVLIAWSHLHQIQKPVVLPERTVKAALFLLLWHKRSILVLSWWQPGGH